MNLLNLVIMFVVGALSGTLAARIVGGRNFGPIVNSLLGIAGAVVGSMLFNLLKITPGSNIVKALSNTFQVDLPLNLIGMMISAIVGSIIILLVARIITGRTRK